jgi:uncharacterized membrane protein YgcG
MTEPPGASPTDNGDGAALHALDLALDRLAGRPEAIPPGPAVGAARDAAPAATGRTAALAALAAELREAVPAPPPGAADRGRAAFLAQAAAVAPDRPGAGEPAAGRSASARERRRRGRGRGAVWRRSLPLRVAALAAALVVLVAVPAAVARQARPGTALWPLRQVGQQVRLGLADDPVREAHLRLNTAGAYLAAGAGAGEERREDMADRARDEIRAALGALDDLTGSRAEAERARAERLLADVEALERQRDPDDSSGQGPGPEPGEQRSGPGGGADRSGSGGGEDRSGSADDGSSGSGGGGSGSGSGGSGSGRRGSGDD